MAYPSSARQTSRPKREALPGAGMFSLRMAALRLAMPPEKKTSSDHYGWRRLYRPAKDNPTPRAATSWILNDNSDCDKYIALML
jgi:hypothetical protein